MGAQAGQEGQVDVPTQGEARHGQRRQPGVCVEKGEVCAALKGESQGAAGEEMKSSLAGSVSACMICGIFRIVQWHVLFCANGSVHDSVLGISPLVRSPSLYMGWLLSTGRTGRARASGEEERPAFRSRLPSDRANIAYS